MEQEEKGNSKYFELKISVNYYRNLENTIQMEHKNIKTSKYWFIFLIFLSFQNLFSQPFTNSNLPIVVITTDTNPLTGQPYQIVDDPRVLGTMKIIKRPDGTTNYLTDINTPAFLNYDGRIDIEIRGSTSQSLPKKPYGFSTLQADNVSNNNVSLVDMPAENDWILNSFAYDPSYMRDYLSYNLYSQLGNYASRSVYCEVVINGDYKGLYLLQEKLKDDSNRINILDIQPEDITAEALTGGYITKADKTTGGDPVAWGMINNDGDTTYFIHDVPKPEDVVYAQNNYIKNQFLSLDAQANTTNLFNGYPSIIDVPTFIDFMLINEFASNVDAYKYSTYYHKDRAGKLRAGPVWDCNLTFGNDLFYLGFDRSHYNVWQFSNGDNEGPNFWYNLFSNTTFKCYLSKRWYELIQVGKPLNQANINTFINNTTALITDAANRDSQKWFSTSANLSTHTTAIKNFITNRTIWISNNIGTYSACNYVSTPSLVISKIHYNPLAITGFTSNNQEFIEITNTGSATVNLSGVYLQELGVSYQFPYNSTVLAGQKIYLASNTTAFQSRYGVTAFGQFTRNLSNKSHKLELADAFGNIIDFVEYKDAAPWPTSPDGTGPYLQLIDNTLDNSLASSWIASNQTLTATDHNFNSNSILFYPNPATDILTITSDFKVAKVEIFDSNSRLLKQLQPNSQTLEINITSLEKGIYFIKIYSNETITTKKLLKN